jgi:antirestriction protein ArdC
MLTNILNSKMNKNQVYDYVTERITERLAQGEIPWLNTRTKPLIRARNLASGKPYNGVNFWLLNYRRIGASPFYLTFKQASALKGSVRRGERSSMVVFWTKWESDKVDPKTGEKQVFPVLRYYSVFNIDQCDNITDPLLEPVNITDPIAKAEEILANVPNRCRVDFSSNIRAFYRPGEDRIVMPQSSSFTSREQYYRTFFHELAHSTGHQSRLDRFNTEEPGTLRSVESYGFEELVAELTASYLCAEAGIFEENCEKHAGYCQHWLKELKDAPRLFVKAAGAAQRACDYLLGVRERAEVAE